MEKKLIIGGMPLSHYALTAGMYGATVYIASDILLHPHELKFPTPGRRQKTAKRRARK